MNDTSNNSHNEPPHPTAEKPPKLGKALYSCTVRGVTVNVYQDFKRGRMHYKIRWGNSDGYDDLSAKTLTEAKTKAKQRATQLANLLPSNEQLATLRIKALMFDRSNRVLRAYGWDIIRAADQVSQMLEEMGSEGLRHFAHVYGPRLAKVKHHTVAEALAKYSEYRTKAGAVTKGHIANQSACLKRFVKEHGDTEIDKIDCGQLNDWLADQLEKQDAEGSTRDKWYYALRGFFAYAKHQLKALPILLPTEMELVARLKYDAAEPGIFTLPQIHQLGMALPDQETLLAYVLVIFGHVRPEEVLRMEYSDFKRTADTGLIREIYIRPKIAKGRKGQKQGRTIAPLKPNLAKILNALVPQERRGLVFDNKQVFGRIRAVAAAFEIEWKHNVLRHCCDSYAVAAGDPRKEVAAKSGHTESVQKKHYINERVNHSDARKYWMLSFGSRRRLQQLPRKFRSKLEEAAARAAAKAREQAKGEQMRLFPIEWVQQASQEAA